MRFRSSSYSLVNIIERLTPWCATARIGVGVGTNHEVYACGQWRFAMGSSKYRTSSHQFHHGMSITTLCLSRHVEGNLYSIYMYSKYSASQRFALRAIPAIEQTYEVRYLDRVHAAFTCSETDKRCQALIGHGFSSCPSS